MMGMQMKWNHKRCVLTVAFALLLLVLVVSAYWLGTLQHPGRAGLEREIGIGVVPWVTGPIFGPPGQARSVTDAREDARRRPHDLSARYALGVALYREGQFSEAAREFERLIAARPDIPEQHLLLAYCYWLQGQSYLQSARDVLARLASIAEQADAQDRVAGFAAGTYAELGGLYLDLRRVPEARRALEKALQLDPALGAAHVELGRLLLYSGDTSRASLAFQQALNCPQEDKYSAAHAGLGYVALLAGDRVAAQERFLAALRLDSENEWAQVGLRYAQGRHR